MAAAAKWERLSARVLDMIRAENQESAIGFSEQEALSYLDAAGCPHHQPFVDYYVRYAGLKFDVGTGLRKSRYEFSSTPGRNSVWWNDYYGEWQVSIGGEPDCSPLTRLIRPDGSVILTISGLVRGTVEASSFEAFLEGCAMHHWVMTRDLMIDTVFTSHPHPPKWLLETLGLDPVPEAADGILGWWTDWGRGVGVEPVRFRDTDRFMFLAFWHSGDTLFAKEIEAAYSHMLEPTVLARRQGPGIHELREEFSPTGHSAVFDAVDVPRVPEALSFRTFVREQLRRLSELGRVSSTVPEDDPGLEKLLLRNIQGWRELADSLAVYCAAIGLVAFGHKGYCEQILLNMPRESPTWWPEPLWAAKYLGFLFPPRWLVDCPVEETDKVLRWIRENLDRLYWNDQEGCYQTHPPD